MKVGTRVGLVAIVVAMSLLVILVAVGGDAGEKDEAWQLIQSTTQYWQTEQYEEAKNVIDAKLGEKPGWIPAVILVSAYHRWVESDLDAAVAALDTIDDSIAGLDTDTYAEFLAIYSLYEQDIAAESAQSFTEVQKADRLEAAREIYEYFPASEIVAYYFLWLKKDH